MPESADWYNSSLSDCMGSNVPQTRTPDAHFFTEVRYKGTKTVAVTPDYAEIAKLCDQWLNPKQGTDSAMAMAMGHVILNEFHVKRQTEYFSNYVRTYTDMPMLVMLDKHDSGKLVAGRMLRAADLVNNLDQEKNPEWKTIAIDEKTQQLVAPQGSMDFRWEGAAKWNLEPKDGKSGEEVTLQLGLLENHDDVVDVAFPYFGGIKSEYFEGVALDDVLVHRLPAKRITLANGEEKYVTTVYDLLLANYGVDRGLNDENCATKL